MLDPPHVAYLLLGWGQFKTDFVVMLADTDVDRTKLIM